MEFSRLNKKIDFLVGSTFRLKKQLRKGLGEDVARDNTEQQINRQHRRSRFAKKMQML